MRKWKRVRRCRCCGKVYPDAIPYICERCGTQIGMAAPFIALMMPLEGVTETDKCERVVGKKGIFGWKIRKEGKDAARKRADYI